MLLLQLILRRSVWGFSRVMIPYDKDLSDKSPLTHSLNKITKAKILKEKSLHQSALGKNASIWFLF